MVTAEGEEPKVVSLFDASTPKAARYSTGTVGRQWQLRIYYAGCVADAICCDTRLNCTRGSSSPLVADTCAEKFIVIQTLISPHSNPHLSSTYRIAGNICGNLILRSAIALSSAQLFPQNLIGIAWVEQQYRV